MKSNLVARLLLGVICCVGLTARAQPGASQASSSFPGDLARAEAAAPPLSYRSPFEGYRSHRDITPGPWRAMNDEVARIGGWKAYAREAQEAAPLKPPAEVRSSPPAPANTAPRAP